MKKSTAILLLLVGLLAGLNLSHLSPQPASAATDSFATNVAAGTLPAMACEDVTASDSTDLTNVARAVYVGTGGDITLKLRDDGSSHLLKNVASGSILSVRALRIYSTGTTATNMVALR